MVRSYFFIENLMGDYHLVEEYKQAQYLFYKNEIQKGKKETSQGYRKLKKMR
jgi:hypothetical protein